MQEFTSCKQAMQSCMDTKTFAVAHLYKEEKTMDMHVHDCYEIYYSISGGKQFLIDNKFYPIEPGDIFLINQYESHYITQIESSVHERIVISVHPDFVKSLGDENVKLDGCFLQREAGFSHRISLNKEQRHDFLYLVNKIVNANDFAHEITEKAAFMELLVLLNKAYLKPEEREASKDTPHYNSQVDEILGFINSNIENDLRLEELAKTFHMSESYICRIFKQATGTTVNKYVTARRITIAKALLSSGHAVSETYEQSGFSDYSSFFKAFTKTVGISPKKYAQCSNK
ncbi:MAG: helix-turn-helix domain-containing protein [Lachnospiraceae bacterium]|nr:helix-turn-helix domain-containing protein [Lachnospiraceae bacterium]